MSFLKKLNVQNVDCFEVLFWIFEFAPKKVSEQIRKFKKLFLKFVYHLDFLFFLFFFKNYFLMFFIIEIIYFFIEIIKHVNFIFLKVKKILKKLKICKNFYKSKKICNFVNIINYIENY